MAYIAKSVCTFAGHSFLKGEVIPSDLVLKSKVHQLVKTRVIEVVDGPETSETKEADGHEIKEDNTPDVSVEHPAKRGRKKKSE